MKKFLSFIFFVFINYLILMGISFGIYYFYHFTLKDISFVVGIIALIVSILINVSGSPIGLSLQSFGNINSQYVSSVDLKAKQHEEKTDRIEINIKGIINSSVVFSSILILVTAYYIK